MSEIEIPYKIKELLEIWGGTHIGIVNELDLMLKTREITEYAVYKNTIYIYTDEKINRYTRKNYEQELASLVICRRSI